MSLLITPSGMARGNLPTPYVSWKECCMKKVFVGFGLRNPEVAKTNVLCKWIVKAMEHGESNMQLMLRFRLVRFNPQRGWS